MSATGPSRIGTGAKTKDAKAMVSIMHTFLLSILARAELVAAGTGGCLAKMA